MPTTTLVILLKQESLNKNYLFNLGYNSAAIADL